jgi:hypothetical protein
MSMSRPPISAVAQVEAAVTEDFVALLVARNRCGPAIPIEELLHRNAIPLEDFQRLLTSGTFVATTKRYVHELTQAGFGVEAKSAVLHEAGLPIVYEILADPAQPALARLKAHEILGTVSGKGDPARAPGANTLNVGINGSGAYQLVINLGPTPTDTTTLRAPVEKLVHDAVATDLIDPDYEV